MQSKAFCKSQNNPLTINFLFIDDNILLINVYVTISVELLHLKPNFSFTNILFEVKCWYSLLNISKIFENTRSNEIGL